MSLAQLHYTSAPPGPDGSGFRFTAVSPGVPATLLREAEQLIGYEPPRDLPDRPDAEQLKSFPKAFSCTELSDGGRLLCRSVYTGADYSGRWGNFHAHAVHLPPGTRLPDGALPITVWESPRWAEATPPGGRPEPVDRIEPSRLLRRDGLVAFARSRADRLAAFFADLRTLADGSDVRQLVLVERDSADVAQWIALACTVLPREQAHRLTFTTYTRRPQQARQQIVGALPSSEPVGHDHRFRVHDCTGRAAGEPVADAWAEVCARIWTAGRPELFRDTARDLGDTADDVGRLAVTALAGGIALPPAARAAAARRAAARAGDLPEPTLTALLGELARAADGDDGSAGSEEPAALAALLARLDGHVPTAVSAPLAARVLTLAVRGRGPVPALGAGSLTAEVRAALARDLAPALRHGIADPDGPATGRPLSLLHLADLLDVDCTDLLPEFAGRIARELVRTEPAHETPDAVVPGSAGARSAAAGPEAPGSAVPGSAVPRSEMPGPAWPRLTHPGSDHPAPGQPGTARAGASLSGTSRPGSARPEAAQQGPARPGADHPRSAQPGTSGPGSGRPGSADSPPPCPPALLDALRGHPALRTALFGALDALAKAQPAVVAGRLAGSGLPVALDPGFPHLRMCVLGGAAGGPAGGDRRGRLRAVLHTAGVSPHADPAVLHTAFRLVWPDEPPTGEEASLLLNELGSDAHRLAGTRDLLVAAALAAPAEDTAAPLLAADLLRCFTTELDPADRAPLLLLEYAALLGTDGEGENWVERVRALRDGAVEPVPEQVTRRVYDALARRLLAVPVPESELYALARSGDTALLAAYERAARGPAVAERLRTAPSYAAARFCDWSAYQGTHPGWEATRTALLAKVLRPAVRALPAEDRTAVEEALRRTGRGRLDAYRAWNRPGALGRLAGRLTGRGRREDERASWPGDVQPPAGGGDR